MSPQAQAELDKLEDTPGSDELVASRLKRAERNNERQFSFGILTFTNLGTPERADWRLSIQPKKSRK